MNLQSQIPGFDNLPRHDYLNLYHEGGTSPHYKRVADLLGFQRKDLSIMTGIPATKIRLDDEDKIRRELKEMISQWAYALALVGDHFKEENRTIMWFMAPNPLLGNVSPKDMVRRGKFKRLLTFIQNSLELNKK